MYNWLKGSENRKRTGGNGMNGEGEKIHESQDKWEGLYEGVAKGRGYQKVYKGLLGLGWEKLVLPLERGFLVLSINLFPF